MDSEEPYSALLTTWGRTFMGLLVLQPLVLALGIGLGMKFPTRSACTSTQEQPSKPVSAADEKQRSGFGIRSPGYGKTFN